jgi:hypothetical protein
MTYRLAMPILALAIVAPAAALAHPGNHDNVAVSEVANHLTSSLFHLSVLAIVFCVLAVAFGSALKRRDRKSEAD